MKMNKRVPKYIRQGFVFSQQDRYGYDNFLPALTYDDINLIPRYSEVASRAGVDLSTQLSQNFSLKIPVIAAPMDTVCEDTMAIALARLGGVGCIHRFNTIDEQVNLVKNVRYAVYGEGFGGIYESWDTTVPIMAAVGANGDYLERTQALVSAGANVILIDVAHGDHKFVIDAIQTIKRQVFGEFDVIAGNIVTTDAAKRLADAGANALRVGIGGGSLCTTRIKTGFGVPNVTAIMDCLREDMPVIADGGIRSSGDMAKAIAVGAASVMLGSLLAGTDEAPGAVIEDRSGQKFKRYRGSASLETKLEHGMEGKNVEGESTIIPYKGSLRNVMNGLLDGLRSALSYGGASSIEEFCPQIVIATSAGIQEARPHLL